METNKIAGMMFGANVIASTILHALEHTSQFQYAEYKISTPIP
jgi:hypothetical protein